jgi:LysM repeat protein
VKRNRKYALAGSHVVKKGENLNAIAKKYRVKVSALRQINSLNSSSVIHPGQTIKLMKDNNKGKRTTASSSGKFHTVRRGETLISIAKKYNVSLPLLMEKNKLSFKSILVAGRQIVIPQ